MREIVIATKNLHKLREIKNILKEEKLKILSLLDFENFPEIEEDGNSYAENAIKKAKLSAEITKRVSLADDSGIEIEYLGWKPGIYSSSFLGENTPYSERNREILKLLKNVPESKRRARYVCVIAISTPEGVVKTFEGRCAGRIAHEIKGRYGFGYDPIFFVPSYKKNMAELPPSIKNKISHRARAINKAKKYLKNILLSLILFLFLISTTSFSYKTPEILDKKKEAEIYFKKAIEYTKQKKYQNAIQEYKKVISLFPDFAGSYFNLALIYIQLNDLKNAKINLEKASKLDTKNPEIFYLLGSIYFREKNFSKSKENFKKTLELAPKNSETHFFLGIIYFREKNFNLAEQEFLKTIKYNPERKEAYLNLATVYQKQKKNKEAIKYYEKFLKIEENFPEVYFNLGSIYIEEKNFKEAENCFRKGLKLEPSNELARVNLAATLLYQNKLEEAKKEYEECIKLGIERKEIYKGLTYIYQFIHEHKPESHQQMINVYRKLLKYEPENLELYLKIADVYKEEKKYEEALKEIEEVLKRNPKHIQAIFSKGSIYEAENKYEDAIKEYRRVEEIDKKNIEMYIRIARIFERQNKYDEAIGEYKKILEFSKDNNMAYDNIARLNSLKGNLDEAENIYKKLIEKNPNLTFYKSELSAVYTKRGENYEKENKKELAISEYKKALEVYPENKRAKELLEKLEKDKETEIKNETPAEKK